MDFVSLAEGSHRFLRSLVEDDDFARIDNDNNNKVVNAAKAVASAAISTAAPGSIVAPDSNSHQPLLSPTAEAELFLLATNFLLCELL